MHLTLIVAMTADGMIARDAHHLANWTSKEDKQLFVKLTKEAGVMIMGKNTFDLFKKPLPGRLHVVVTHQKLQDTDQVKYVSGDPTAIVDMLENMGHKRAMLCGGSQINSLFLEKRLITDMIITIESRLFGKGINIFSSSCDVRLELQEHKALNKDTLMARYKLVY